MKKEYTFFGEEWEKEISKLPKSELIGIIRKLQTGTSDLRTCQIETAKDAQIQVEGIINDLVGGIIEKDEALGLLGEYTGRIMHVFGENAKKLFKEQPELLCG